MIAAINVLKSLPKNGNINGKTIHAEWVGHAIWQVDLVEDSNFFVVTFISQNFIIMQTVPICSTKKVN